VKEPGAWKRCHRVPDESGSLLPNSKKGRNRAPFDLYDVSITAKRDVKKGNFGHVSHNLPWEQ